VKVRLAEYLRHKFDFEVGRYYTAKELKQKLIVSSTAIA